MHLFIVLILALLPSIGLAQHITVRSGDHADFSRLVFELPDPQSWEMGRVDKGYEIRFQDNNFKIDISNVYLRITHDRIENIFVSRDYSKVVLTLNCACYADAFEFRPGLLVVDVKDGKPPITSRFETVFKSGELSENQRIAPQKNPEVTPNSNEDSKIHLVQDIFVRPPIKPTLSRPTIGLFSAGSANEVIHPAPQVVEMQAKIIQQIGRAASQGLLDANLSNLVQEAPIHDEVEDISAPPPSAPFSKPEINIHIQNSIDREFAGLERRHLMTGSGEKCMRSSLFNIAEWGDEDSILGRVSEQRSMILGEFDTVNAQEVKALARAYIYAGFGIEALEVLTAFNVTLRDKKVLMAMAQIVDGAVPDNHTELEDQVGCDSASALWAALASPDISVLQKINSAAILSTFSGLPVHLRRRLGPALAQKFLAFGNVEMARGLRDSIARVAGDSGAEFRLLDAQLDLHRGQNTSAERALVVILDSDEEAAPKALIELLEIRLQKKESINPKFLKTAESYIFEQMDTEIAADLKRLIALSLGQAGDFLGALNTLNELENFETHDSRQKRIAWDKIIIGLATEAPEDILLKFVFSAMDGLTHQNISPSVRRKLAFRLLQEGWPEKAESVLAASSPLTADDRIILARVEILKGQPGRALELLENVAGDQAAQMRALAYVKSGEHRSAAHEYQTLMDEKSQVSAAWKGNDWKQLAKVGSKVDQAAAKVMLSQSSDISEEASTTVGTIEIVSSLLMKSEKERTTMAQLLKEYSLLEQ